MMLRSLLKFAPALVMVLLGELFGEHFNNKRECTIDYLDISSMLPCMIFNIMLTVVLHWAFVTGE